MSELTIPFSLSDILERVIPGSLVIASVAVSFQDQFASYSIPSAIAYGALLSGSYALGVSLNSLSGLVRIKGYRQYWTESPSPMEAAVRRSIESHFGVGVDDRAWRLCYGTVIKNGYGANTQLILGLDVFCRAMTIASAAATLVFLIASVIALLHRTAFAPHSLFAAAAALLAVLFRRGAGIYSQAFVGSVYEGFFDWWCAAQAERAGANENTWPER